MTIVEKDEILQIERIETAPFGTNAYVVICEDTKESVLIDAPGDADKIQDRLEGTNPICIIITHRHMDHTGALQRLKEELNIPVAAHVADAENLPVEAEMLLDDGNIVSFGNVTLEVLHTPGHTPGSICLQTGNILLAGDTIFPGGPGKTGSPDNFREIIQSIEQKIFVLPEVVKIYPGHGEPTTVKNAKEEYTIFSGKSHDLNLCGDVLWLKD
ncbi:MAG: MBL fold metallo-hydrolase [Candidatus Aminicenantes bacterium]|nr:MAG: MBL fold metallo-hydrolase [Candidatus Aminicenantes bacterium]